jgi:hypothetical protein
LFVCLTLNCAQVHRVCESRPTTPRGRATQAAAGRLGAHPTAQSHLQLAARYAPATSAAGLGSPLPHLRRDWARPCHICAGTGPTLPHLHRDWAHPCHICAGTDSAATGAGHALPLSCWLGVVRWFHRPRFVGVGRCDRGADGPARVLCPQVCSHRPHTPSCAHPPAHRRTLAWTMQAAPAGRFFGSDRARPHARGARPSQ